MVGLVGGTGELAGYALRLWSGRLADRTHCYWTITIVGYAVNLLAVPLLALAGHWSAAAALMVVERVGKAIRTPARDVMLSYATTHTGRGWGFGLHEALDQTGATVGPLVVAGVLLWRGDHRTSFAVLLLPALAALALLLIGRADYPRPQDLERPARRSRPRAFHEPSGVCRRHVPGGRRLRRRTRCSRITSSASAACPRNGSPCSTPSPWRWTAWPRWSWAAGSTGEGSWCSWARPRCRRWWRPWPSAPASAWRWRAPCCGGSGWGPRNRSCARRSPSCTPAERRGSAYGLFNMLFGVAWFAGSALMGWLYDVSIPALIAFSVALQGAALSLFVVSHRLALGERRVS